MFWQDHMKRQLLPTLCCTHFDLATQAFQFLTFHMQLNSLTRPNVPSVCTLNTCAALESEGSIIIHIATALHFFC